MVDAAFIDAFTKSFWVFNTSRGNNVVTADLVAAMNTGKVLGAGLDVLEYEKLSLKLFQEDNTAFRYLLKAGNVILSPHVAGWTLKVMNGWQVIVDKIKAKYFSK
jgi:D-3-phosphoglycerate dehydrogenase